MEKLEVTRRAPRLSRRRHRAGAGGADINVSLIIATRNRAATLDRALAAIARLDVPPDTTAELIVVDNGSTDETAAVFEKHRPVLPFPARRLFEPAPGVGNALNAGYRASRGEILAFTDDDCYPAPDFLGKAAAAFADRAVGMVTGRILLHDSRDAPMTVAQSTRPRRMRAGAYVRPGQYHGANLCFRRAALDSIGGFDPLFGPGSYIGSGADVDAAGRVSLAGWDGLYDPAIVVSHHHGRGEDDRNALERRYAIGSGGYHAKLLIEQRRIAHFLRYLRGWPKKLLVRPSTVMWEVVGAVRFLRRPPRASVRGKPRARLDGGTRS